MTRLERALLAARLPFIQEVRRAIVGLREHGQARGVRAREVVDRMTETGVPGRWTSVEVRNAMTYLCARRELERVDIGLYVEVGE